MNIRGFKFVGNDKEGYDIYVISRGWFGRDKVKQLQLLSSDFYMDGTYRYKDDWGTGAITYKVDKIGDCHKIINKYLTDKCPISIVTACN